MGYNSHHTGRITITPPLTWAQIKNNTSRGLQGLRLITHEDAVDTEDGRTTVITGTAIVPLTTSPYSGYEIREELQAVIDAFPRNDFAGTIEARPEDPDGTPWRYTIRGRQVVRQVPRVSWVDEETQ